MSRWLKEKATITISFYSRKKKKDIIRIFEEGKAQVESQERREPTMDSMT